MIGKPCTDVVEPRLPQHLAGRDVDGLELAVEIADERDAAARREHGRQERRALLERPQLLHRARVVRRELADVAVGARHLEEAPVGARAAAARDELDLLARGSRCSFDYSGMISRDVGAWCVDRLPVVAAFGARAALHPLADLARDDVGAIARLAGLGIDAVEDVLEQRLVMIDVRGRSRDRASTECRACRS